MKRCRNLVGNVAQRTAVKCTISMLPRAVLQKKSLKRGALFLRKGSIHSKKGKWVVVVVGLQEQRLDSLLGMRSHAAGFIRQSSSRAHDFDFVINALGGGEPNDAGAGEGL